MSAKRKLEKKKRDEQLKKMKAIAAAVIRMPMPENMKAYDIEKNAVSKESAAHIIYWLMAGSCKILTVNYSQLVRRESRIENYIDLYKAEVETLTEQSLQGYKDLLKRFDLTVKEVSTDVKKEAAAHILYWVLAAACRVLDKHFGQLQAKCTRIDNFINLLGGELIELKPEKVAEYDKMLAQFPLIIKVT